jgi:diguanylate cyclase (GGDEF)-like protein
MLDLDELKSINDRSGHHAGDAALRAVADTVRGGIRRIDVAARYGGDEFVAVLPETDPTGGWVLAEKIRIGVSSRTIDELGQPPTVSVGVVSFPRDGATADALMISADRAMYASKRAGRNRVAGPESEMGMPVGVMADDRPVTKPEVVEPPV